MRIVKFHISIFDNDYLNYCFIDLITWLVQNLRTAIGTSSIKFEYNINTII